MGRGSPDPRLSRRAVAAVLLLLAAGGCVAVGAGSATTANPEPFITVADRLTTAIRERRPGDFIANFAPDEAGRRMGLQWYSVLAPAGALVTADGDHRLRVTWTLPGDRRAARSTLAASWTTSGGRTVIAGVSQQVGAPLWTLQASRLTSAASGTLVSAASSDADRDAWSTRLDRAADEVRAAEILPESSDFSGGLVIEAPADPGDFQTMSGVPAAEAGAVAVCSTGTPRIVVNPMLSAAGEDAVAATLTHEAVHVATDSPCVAASRTIPWVVEGLAESVAARSHPAVAETNRQSVATYVKEHGVPDDLPVSLSSQTEYALAQLAIDQVRAHWTRDQAADFFDRAIHDSPMVTDVELAQARRWYRTELERIATSV